jgi:homeobox-leucine zipper protein
MGFNDQNSLHLVLGLSLNSLNTTPKEITTTNTTMNPYSSTEPSLTLGLSGTESPNVHRIKQTSSPHSFVVSSFSNGRVLQVKREREEEEDQEVEEERVSSRVSDEDEDATNARKKLRLTKEQSLLLEESFKLQSTLNPVRNYIFFSLFNFLLN